MYMLHTCMILTSPTAPTSFAIIFLSLLLAFSESLREIVSKSHKITIGFLREFILNPFRTSLRWDSITGKIPAIVVPEDSEMRKRLDEYLGYGRTNMQLDDDIWQRWRENRLF